MNKTLIFQWRWRLVSIWIVVFTVVTALAFLNGRDALNAGSQSKKAICALVADFKGRIAIEQAFLDTHPTDVAGIATAKAIETTLKNQQTTSNVLDSEVHCK